MRREKVDISVAIPIYKNEPFIHELISRLKTELGGITKHFEIVLVDDRSPDNCWELIKEKAANDPCIIGIRFSRNFGQHIGITAGIDHCSGDWVVVMDGDCQDRPEEIINLYNKAQEGYDVVFARRQDRKDGFFTKFFSKLFHKTFDLLTGSQSDAAVANFGIYSRKVIDNFKKIRERSRLFPLLIKWLGFNTAYLDVKHGERSTGKSAYTFRRKVSLAFDAIVSMSNKPLKLFIKTGILFSFGALLSGIWFVIRYLAWNIPPKGWTIVLASLFFLAGLILAMAGVLGLYLGKVFDEAKNRPLYVTDEILNLKK